MVLSKDYEREKHNLTEQIKMQKEFKLKNDNNELNETSIKKIIQNILKFDRENVDRNILLKLIDRIVIHNKDVYIKYKFCIPE